MKTYKCDICKKHIENLGNNLVETLCGTIAHDSMGYKLAYYPSNGDYHFCQTCATNLVETLMIWVTQRWDKLKTVSN